jgi:transcriptional accessory protein Tex/SPT6
LIEIKGQKYNFFSIYLHINKPNPITMIIRNYASVIAKELGLREKQVKNTLDLLTSGATIPFISRYRKEATDSLDEVQIGNIKELHEKWTELDKRRASILDSIDEQGKLTPELKEQINNALTMSELEDLYLPYKPKRKTRATIAVEKGLEPLALILYDQQNIDLKILQTNTLMKKKGFLPLKKPCRVPEILLPNGCAKINGFAKECEICLPKRPLYLQK